MQQPLRIIHFSVVVAFVLAFIQPLATPEASPVPDGSQVYIGHASHMTALIPADWRVPIGHQADYEGDDGFVLSFGVAENGTGDACAAYTSSQNMPTEITGLIALITKSTTWRSHPACALSGTMNGPVQGLVVPLSESFVDVFGTRMGYGVLLTDAAHFEQIASTLDLTDARVTPVAYLSSVIDIVEARSWYTESIPWDIYRPNVLELAAGYLDMEDSAVLVGLVFGYLQQVGDFHSHAIPAADIRNLAETEGMGMKIGGNQIVAVYKGSPADLAGVRRGDVILAIDDIPFKPNLRITETSAGSSISHTYRLARSGVSDPIEVTIESATFDQFLPPTGERLGGNLGYIEIDQFTSQGRESDYVEVGNTVIRNVNSPEVCGWIVDLRLNLGGSYIPMVSSVGSILGNGPFWGYMDRAGSTGMVSYENGSFVFGGGHSSPDYLAPGTRYLPDVTSPPVAVLTSNTTSSSGEVTTVAFVGRPNTRLFGEPTAGFTVGNTSYELWDGTLLALAEGAYVDRNGTVYTAGVTPDVAVDNDWSTFRTPDDPVIAAASDWLQQQPSCAGSATPAATPSH